ncbi:DUF222 domain-containing protein [Microbacterium awajiense]|uniref:DUF222 domain-containing protein n=2 Tax=Microbacterium awajiense TaxID=415214 RepID=A0ABP7A9T8_9MICO
MLHTRTQIAALEAEQSTLLAEAVEVSQARAAARRAAGRREGTDLALREVTAELAAAMRLSDRSVQARMSTAYTLTDAYPTTLDHLADGRIDPAHAAVIVDAGTGLTDPHTRAAYERLVLDAATDHTPTRLREIARAIAARLDPSLLTDAHQRSQADRCVKLTELTDGLSRIIADLPTVNAHGIHDRLTQMAHDLTRPAADTTDGPGDTDAVDDPRTIDQRRADILTDLLLSATPVAHGTPDRMSRIRAHVQVTIPVTTLAGVATEPALLAGVGPIDPDTARALAGAAPGWDRVLTDPHCGVPLAVDRYRPSTQLLRYLRVRDERCRFPGCVQKPWRCDADHTADHARGGETSACNLALLCRRHHTVKHATAWTVRQLDHGVLEWTSPTGRAYRDRPPASVRFVPTRPPETGAHADERQPDPPF